LKIQHKTSERKALHQTIISMATVLQRKQ